jgi:hypothetical protein
MKTKGRKRTADNILDEYNTPSSSTPKQILTEDVEFTTRKPRDKKQCFCSKCNGKWVDPRTKDEHEHDHKGQTASLGRLHSEQSIPLPANETPMSQVLIEMLDSTMSLVEPLDSMMSTDTHSSHTPDNDMYEEQILSFLSRKKRTKTDTFRPTTEGEIEENYENSETEYDTDDIRTGDSSAQDSSDDDDDDEFSNIFEDYSHPIFDFDTPADTSELPKDELIKGILIWIMKFRSSYNIPNTAIDDLIKFIKIVLKECKSIDHESFTT